MPSSLLPAYHRRTASDRARYGDGSKKDLTTEEPIPWLDQSGLAALLAGSLLVLITFFTSYSHVDIPSHASIRVN